MPHRNVATRGLTEGALLAGLIVVIVVVGVFFLPSLALLLAPIPVAWLLIRWGGRVAVLAAIVASLILAWIVGPVQALLAGAVFAPTGLALGWGIRKGVPASMTILVTAVVLLVMSLLSLWLTVRLMGINPIEETIQAQIEAWKMSLALQRRLGAPSSQAEALEKTLTQLPEFLRMIIPVAFLLGAGIWAYFIYLVAGLLLRRFGYPLPSLPPMLHWRIQTKVVWLLLGLTVLSGVMGARWPEIRRVFVNLQILDVLVFGFQGLLIGLYYLRKLEVPRWFQAILVVLVLSIGVSWLVLMWVGLLDTWFNYRRLGVQREPA
ncbi:MAG: DUF2232 domain-containing protein [Armatimonadota bacterium]|nr:DUF2232 domain-containing protein [Armatimonadota bacterium]